MVRVWLALAPTSRFPKARLVGEMVKSGMPVPVRVEVSCCAPALTERVPVRAPRAVGVKTTLIWQLAPPASAPQLLETTEKSPLAGATLTMELKVELLVQVKVCAAEGKPMGCEPKSCVAGVSVGMPPSSVSSKRLNSRSFSCGVMGELTAHSLGKFSLPLLEPFSTWYSLKRTRPHWPDACPTGVSKTNCMVLPVEFSVSQD